MLKPVNFTSLQKKTHVHIQNGTKRNHIPTFETQSFKDVQKFATLASKNMKCNVLLNDDDYQTSIYNKKPDILIKRIEQNIETLASEWGCSKKEIESIMCINSGFKNPVCGIVANNVMKLFLDTEEVSYNSQESSSLSFGQLIERISTLPEDKHW
ncbi:MAG: hypothetical protein EKE20_01375 [Candidatus Symbiopectobacterium sp. Dall1.0]|nr:hypothetical protein [Candidatus Symbiopectobacterium sp. Dall1.0]